MDTRNDIVYNENISKKYLKSLRYSEPKGGKNREKNKIMAFWVRLYAKCNVNFHMVK